MKEDEAAIVKINNPIITSTSSKIAQNHNGITSPLINNENLRNCISEHSSFNGKLTLEEEHQEEEEEELKTDGPTTMDLKMTAEPENKPATPEEESCFKTPALPTPKSVLGIAIFGYFNSLRF